MSTTPPSADANNAASEASFAQILALLRAKDDTSRFVGLTLLQRTLDIRPALREDVDTIVRAWEALPKTFLLKLLRAQTLKKANQGDADDARREQPRQQAQEADSMVSLAVAVIHSFANFLSEEELAKTGKSSAAFVQPLAKLLHRVESVQQALIWQTLSVLVKTPSGAEEILGEVGEATQTALRKAARIGDSSGVRQVEEFMRLLRELRTSTITSVDRKAQWDLFVDKALEDQEQAPALVFDLLAEVVDSDVVPAEAPLWLPRALIIMKQHIKTAPTAAIRKSSILLAGSLLRNLPPRLDFSQQLFFADPAYPTFHQLFVKLLLVDIRASIPSLLASLAEPSYPATSLRLATCYDLLGAYLLCLVLLLDEDDENASLPITLDPSMLLSMRSDVTEALSLTLEHLRDRFDASIAGTLGLHSSQRAPERTTEGYRKYEPLPLTWDNAAMPLQKDPIALSALRVLALWVCEDDSDLVRREARGIVDLLVTLYSDSFESAKKADNESLDFRSPVLQILGILFEQERSIADDFINNDGWTILTRDLHERLDRNDLRGDTEDLARVLHVFLDASSGFRPPVGDSDRTENKVGLLRPSAEYASAALALYRLAVRLWEDQPYTRKRDTPGELEPIHEGLVTLRSIAGVDPLALGEQEKEVLQACLRLTSKILSGNERD